MTPGRNGETMTLKTHFTRNNGEITPKAGPDFFGASWRPREHRAMIERGPFAPLTRHGLPMPWSDGYAARMVAAGHYVERRRVVEESPRWAPEYPGEVIRRWETVEVMLPA